MTHTETYTLAIDRLEITTRIGATPAERETPQRVHIWTTLTVRPGSANAQDTLENVVNYSSIVNAIRALADAAPVHLLETLADKIIRICLTDARVQTAVVKVAKPDVYADADSVSITRTHTRNG